jgi:hypothetical protein
LDRGPGRPRCAACLRIAPACLTLAQNHRRDRGRQGEVGAVLLWSWRLPLLRPLTKS